MTQTPSRPVAGRWRWTAQQRAPLGADLCTGIVLVLVEAWLAFMFAFGAGMQAWGARSPEAADAAQLAALTQDTYLLIGMLVVACCAALFRAPWTAGLHLLAAAVLAAVVLAGHQSYDRAHRPAPEPTPHAWYSPCYSGGENCP